MISPPHEQDEGGVRGATCICKQSIRIATLWFRYNGLPGSLVSNDWFFNRRCLQEQTDDFSITDGGDFSACLVTSH